MDGTGVAGRCTIDDLDVPVCADLKLLHVCGDEVANVPVL